MTGGILVLVIIVLFLAAAGLVADALARTLGLYGQPLKPRVRTADANPGGPPLIPASGAARRRPGSAGLPAIDPATLAHLRRRMAGLPAHPHGVPIADTGAMHAVRDELLAARPVNGVYRGTQPRKTVDMIICDPAVTPVVPRYYRAWLEGRWTP